MKILFINTLYPPYIGGGAEIILKSIVDGMAAKGHDVSVLTTGPKPGIHEDDVEGIRVWRAGVHNLYWHHQKHKPSRWQRALWHLRDSNNPVMGDVVENVVRKVKPDLVACHNLTGFSIATWSAVSRVGVPILHTLHDLYNLCPQSNMFCCGHSCQKQCITCKLLRLHHARLSMSVSGVIGVSQFVLQQHLDYGFFPHAKIKKVIHNARFMKTCSCQGLAASDVVTFGFIGALAPAKGVELLIRAFTRINAGRKAKLLIAGTGSEPYQSELMSHQSNHISFLGYTNPDELFSKIDVLVVPSIWNDTLPGVVFESFAFGVPVIGSRRGGIPEMIQENVSGYLFDPDNQDELERIMSGIIEDKSPLDTMRSNAQVSAAPYLDTASWISRYENCFRDLIKEYSNA